MIWPAPSSQSNLGMVCLEHILCVIIWVDLTARAVSQERDQETHPEKKVQTSNHWRNRLWFPSSHHRALKPFFLSHLKSVLDIGLYPVIGLQNQSYSTAASTSPLKHTVPIIKDHKEMSTEEILSKEANLLLHFSKLCQDSQWEEYITVCFQVKASEETRNITA